MWSWDVKGEMRISQLYGNLVVRFTDYLTSNPFYSFLGNNKVNETAETLLNLSKKEGFGDKLKLVPEDLIKGLDSSRFNIEEDRNNFDYIFDINRISTYAGGQFMKKRNKVSQLLRSFPGARVEKIDITDGNIKKKILKLDKFWLDNKTLKDPNFKIKNEFLATNRFFQSNFGDTFGVGIFTDEQLIGYLIFSIITNKYAHSHFSKADTRIVGVYDYLMKESAKILIDKKCFSLNYEQDLGITGLRESKKSFMSDYLKKFSVEFVR